MIFQMAAMLTAAAAQGVVAPLPPGTTGWTVIEVSYPSNGGSHGWISAEPALTFSCDPPVAAAPGAAMPQVVRCRSAVARSRTGRPLPTALRMRYALVAGVGNAGAQGVPVTGKQWAAGCASVAGDTCRILPTTTKVAVTVDPLATP